MKKIVILNKDNLVVAVISADNDDALLQGLVAGLLSEPEIVEVSFDSEAGIGWKYIDGNVVKNVD